jgi:hypothetical protein
MLATKKMVNICIRFHKIKYHKIIEKRIVQKHKNNTSQKQYKILKTIQFKNIKHHLFKKDMD